MNEKDYEEGDAGKGFVELAYELMYGHGLPKLDESAEIALKATLAEYAFITLSSLKMILLEADASRGCPDEIARVKWAQARMRHYLRAKEELIKAYEKSFPS